LLRIYAHYNPKVSYCQGMNYVMGFLYCYYREEDLTFRFFVRLVDKYMRSFFEDDLDSLRGVFYQFDRLLSIFVPDLAEHFKVIFHNSLSYKTRKRESSAVSSAPPGSSPCSQTSSSIPTTLTLS
jgi:hypothetical protein